MSEIDKLQKVLDEHEKRIAKLELLVNRNPITQIKKRSKPTISNLLEELKNERFFTTPRHTKEIVEELKRKGHIYPSRSLTYALQHAVKSRNLGRIDKDKKWAYVAR